MHIQPFKEKENFYYQPDNNEQYSFKFSQLSDIKSNNTGVNTLLGICNTEQSNHSKSKDENIVNNQMSSKSFHEDESDNIKDESFCSYFDCTINHDSKEDTNSICLNKMLKNTEDMKFIQKLINKQTYEKKLQQELRLRQNFYAAYIQRTEYNRSVNEVLIEFGFSRRTWDRTYKKWRLVKYDLRKFLDFQQYKNIPTFSNEQQNYIKELANIHGKQSYRKMANKYNQKYPENKRSYMAIYRQFKPRKSNAYGYMQIFVPYIDQNLNIKMKGKMSKL